MGGLSDVDQMVTAKMPPPGSSPGNTVELLPTANLPEETTKAALAEEVASSPGRDADVMRLALAE